MKPISEIRTEIKTIQREIIEKQEQLSQCWVEYREAAQAKFEEVMNIKPGDKITTSSGEEVFYKEVKIAFSMIYIVCNPVKKDGTASKIGKDISAINFGFYGKKYGFIY